MYELVVGKPRGGRDWQKGVISSGKQGKDLAKQKAERNSHQWKRTRERKEDGTQEAEQDLMKLIEELEEIEEGDLQELEQKTYQRSLEIGRKLLQCRINRGMEEEKAAGKIVGECGHEQRLVGYRKKQILTVGGKVDFKRAYYQCKSCEQGEKREGERHEICSHGRAPADELWGIDQRKTTPGVQKMIS